MSGTITYRGRTNEQFEIKIGGVNSYKAPGNQIETASIPGDIGDVLISSNPPEVASEIVEYAAGLYLKNAAKTTVELRMAQIRDWLLNNTEITKIKDSYEPSFYRLGCFSGDFTPVRKGAGQNFEFPLQFLCDPRRYIDNADDTILNAGAEGALTAEITPPEAWASLIVLPAKPLIKVEGGYNNDAFDLVFTDSTYTDEIGKISFAENIGTVYFDTRTLNATSSPYGGANLNAWITDVSGNVTMSGLITYLRRNSVDAKITITPRWWVR